MSERIHRNIPDSYGLNAFRADPAMEALLGLYLDDAHMELARPQLERLGALVGTQLESLALSADKNPPYLASRARNGADDERIVKHPDFRALERYAFGEFGMAAMSHRAGVFGAARQDAAFGEIRASSISSRRSNSGFAARSA